MCLIFYGHKKSWVQGLTTEGIVAFQEVVWKREGVGKRKENIGYRRANHILRIANDEEQI